MIEVKKKQLVAAFARFVRKNKRYPSQADLIKLGYSRKFIENHFGNMGNLKELAKQEHASIFNSIVDLSDFTDTHFKKLMSTIKDSKRFVITTAVKGGAVDKRFLKALKNYCKKNKATLLVLPAGGNNKEVFLDPALKNENIVFSEVLVAPNIAIRGVDINAKTVDPTSGTSRIGQRNGSSIFASAKQRLKLTATSNTKLPNVVMTTGAVTVPGYAKNQGFNSKRDYLAEHDHVMGALILELDGNAFHFRQVQADKYGRFADLGKLYTGTSVTDYQPEAFVLGDWHSGSTDEKAADAFVYGSKGVTAVTQPKRLVIHDGFDGISINHHEEHNKLLRAKRALENQLNLRAELQNYGDDLERLSARVDEVVVVKSNHDDFLDKYLAEGKYIEDVHNHAFALVLAYAKLNGANPIEAGLNWLGYKLPKVRWLDRDEDFKVAGIELGAHGDRGANGSKGSLSTLEEAYGDVVVGHSHVPQIQRGAWAVGTCSKLKLEYNRGPSSWLHSSCLVYANGQRQLINSIDGRWRRAL